jgi:hypothetical protein
MPRKLSEKSPRPDDHRATPPAEMIEEAVHRERPREAVAYVLEHDTSELLARVYADAIQRVFGP